MRSHPYLEQVCPTCEEDDELRPYCPDCRSRAQMHPNRYRQVYRGGRSGNEGWTKLQELKAKKIANAEAEARKIYEAMHSRPCAECEQVRIIPEGDYLCEECRAGVAQLVER